MSLPVLYHSSPRLGLRGGVLDEVTVIPVPPAPPEENGVPFAQNTPLPTVMLPATPIPPATTNAPVSVLELAAVFDRKT